MAYHKTCDCDCGNEVWFEKYERGTIDLWMEKPSTETPGKKVATAIKMTPADLRELASQCLAMANWLVEEILEDEKEKEAAKSCEANLSPTR